MKKLKKADNQLIREKRHDRLIVRGLPIHSPTYGITGVCDVVEFTEDAKGISWAGETDLFLPIPVEYKHGKPKNDLSDILQLVAQVVCLEEMLVCEISKGYLYYHEIKRREEVVITSELRAELKKKRLKCIAIGPNATHQKSKREVFAKNVHCKMFVYQS